MDRMLLKMRQAMSLEDKIKFTQRRIHEWVDHFGIGYMLKTSLFGSCSLAFQLVLIQLLTN